MEKYASHIIFSPKEAKYINKLDKKDSFYFDTRDDPSLSNWESKDRSSQHILLHKPTKYELKNIQNDMEIAKELLIITDSYEKAKNIQNIVYASTLLFNPTTGNENKSPTFLHKLKDEPVVLEDYYKQQIKENILLSSLATLRAWNHLETIYSLEKLRFSIELDHISPHSAHPIYGQKFLNFYPEYRTHVNIGYSIYIAYSIIEELGLEIRSSQKNPRFKDEKWNPKVKKDIIKRLNETGIKEDDSIYWLQRGEPTEIQKNIEPKMGTKSEYNNLKDVRDIKLRIFEALHYASYIRNFFVAHKFDEITKYLSPYDVYNIQRLARFLLQGKLGFLNKDTEQIIQNL